jgi:hypothetical protein
MNILFTILFVMFILPVLLAIAVCLTLCMLAWFNVVFCSIMDIFFKLFGEDK